MIRFDSSVLIDTVRGLTAQVRASVDERAMRSVGFAGAEIVRDEAKLNAGRNAKTRVIYNNIIVKRLTEESDTSKRQAYLVTVRAGKFGAEGDAYYWRWVENGHSYVRRRKKGESIKLARQVSEMEFGNSKVPAKPFLRPAYDSKKLEVTAAMSKALAANLERLTGGGS